MLKKRESRKRKLEVEFLEFCDPREDQSMVLYFLKGFAGSKTETAPIDLSLTDLRDDPDLDDQLEQFFSDSKFVHKSPVLDSSKPMQTILPVEIQSGPNSFNLFKSKLSNPNQQQNQLSVQPEANQESPSYLQQITNSNNIEASTAPLLANLKSKNPNPNFEIDYGDFDCPQTLNEAKELHEKGSLGSQLFKSSPRFELHPLKEFGHEETNEIKYTDFQFDSSSMFGDAINLSLDELDNEDDQTPFDRVLEINSYKKNNPLMNFGFMENHLLKRNFNVFMSPDVNQRGFFSIIWIA